MFKRLIICVLFCFSAFSFGQDLERGSPERKAILDSIRSTERFSYLAGTQFDVKKIWASKNYAYVCALVINKDGQYNRTDEQLDVYQVILVKQKDQWIPKAEASGLADKPSITACWLLERSLSEGDGIDDSWLKKWIKEYKFWDSPS